MRRSATYNPYLPLLAIQNPRRWYYSFCRQFVREALPSEPLIPGPYERLTEFKTRVGYKNSSIDYHLAKTIPTNETREKFMKSLKKHFGIPEKVFASLIYNWQSVEKVGAIQSLTKNTNSFIKSPPFCIILSSAPLVMVPNLIPLRMVIPFLSPALRRIIPKIFPHGTEHRYLHMKVLDNEGILYQIPMDQSDVPLSVALTEYRSQAGYPAFNNSYRHYSTYWANINSLALLRLVNGSPNTTSPRYDIIWTRSIPHIANHMTNAVRLTYHSALGTAHGYKVSYRS